jgi:hypothetical protein
MTDPASGGLTVGTIKNGGAMTFVQRGSPVPGTNGVLHDGIICYRCNGTGHFDCDCPAKHGTSTGTTPGTTLLHHGFMLAQHIVSTIDPMWILLDSLSTISVFNEPDMLTNIRLSGSVLRAVTNGGHQDYKNLIAAFPNLGQ